MSSSIDEYIYCSVPRLVSLQCQVNGKYDATLHQIVDIENKVGWAFLFWRNVKSVNYTEDEIAINKTKHTHYNLMNWKSNISCVHQMSSPYHLLLN